MRMEFAMFPFEVDLAKHAPMMAPRLLVIAALLSGCDRTPEPVKTLATARLPALRSFVEEVQKECTNAGLRYQRESYGAYEEDDQVLNVGITCTTVRDLGMVNQLKPMRPVPPGSKTGTPYRVGASAEKDYKSDPFPLETVTIPSWLTTEKNTADMCVRSGQPDDADFTEVCVAFRIPAE